jgi:hypothetical protein
VSDAAADRKRFEETSARVNELVNALRLYGANTVYYPTIIFRTPEWLFSDERVFPTRMLAHVPLVYEQIKLKALGRAIRRFGYALERPFY